MENNTGEFARQLDQRLMQAMLLRELAEPSELEQINELKRMLNAKSCELSAMIDTSLRAAKLAIYYRKCCGFALGWAIAATAIAVIVEVVR